MGVDDETVPTGVPLPGFTIKLKPLDGGCLHYINVCSHQVIGMPQDAKDQPVSEEHLDTHGIDNLRVPPPVGPARSVTLGGGTSEALVTDVVFCTSVLRIAMQSPDEDEIATGDPRARRAAAHGRFMRSRLVELAIKNVEEELGGAKLGRDFTLPRGNLEGGANYKGGVGDRRATPIPMLELKRLQQMNVARRKDEELAAAPGPWRSNRAKVGMNNRPAPKIEEVDSQEGTSGSNKPVIKKGFFKNAKMSLYPNGSDEGMHPEGAGDPLGWMPKGLRNRVGVVDTRTASEEEQRKAIAAHADKPGTGGQKFSLEVREILADPVMKDTLARISKDAKAAHEAMSDPKIEKKLRKLVDAGVLQPRGADGKSVAWPPSHSEKAANDPEAAMKAAIAHIMPSKEEIAKLANETDANKFISDLTSLAGMLGLGGEEHTSNAGRLKAVSDLSVVEKAQAETIVSELEQLSQRAKTNPVGAVQDLRELSDKLEMTLPVEGATVGDVVRDLTSSLEEDGDGGVILRIEVPGVTSISGIEVDISDELCVIRTGGGRSLRRRWSQPLDSSRASAKFLKKSSILLIKCPAYPGHPA